jgi:hypothetical protein
MPYYNLTAIMLQTTDIVSFGAAVNDHILSGMLGVGILFMIGAITAMASFTMTNDVGKSGITTGAIMLVTSIFLRAMNWLPDWAMYVSIVGCAISLVFYARRNE